MDIQERLRRVLEAHHLPVGVVLGSTGEVLAKAGDFAAFNDDGLVSALLGPYGSPANTYASVQGSDCLLPQMAGQGDDFAFIDRARAWVVVVFGRNRGDVRALLALSKQVSETIQVMFSPEGAA